MARAGLSSAMDACIFSTDAIVDALEKPKICERNHGLPRASRGKRQSMNILR
jgi:hypothetical protein